MKKATKAVLLSALVFPGTGHIFLKKYKAGVVLAGVSIAGMYYVVSNAIDTAMAIVEQIQNGEVQIDSALAISELASKQPAGSEAWLLNIATYAIIICWIIGIIDSYRAGRLADNNDSAQNSKKT
jgi:hypothetical protein